MASATRSIGQRRRSSKTADFLTAGEVLSEILYAWEAEHGPLAPETVGAVIGVQHPQTRQQVAA